MPIYDFNKNTLNQIDPTTFHSEGILERKNLQAALKQKIEIVSPDSLVIAEEFSEWTDSQRRIDLLAIDKDANIVIIELKRTETGDFMELQAIRYAAMASTLTFKQAVDIFQRYLDKNSIEDNAEEKLLDFLEWETPQEEDFALDVKIVLVSSNFSKELTTSVMWLIERNLNIKCVRLIPYKYDNKVLVDVQHIIPLPEAESYQVKIKEQAEERREARKSSKDYTQYLFDGETYNKRRLVLAIVRKWIAENNPKSLKDIYKVFPESAPHGRFIVTVDVAKEQYSSSGIARYFTKDDEIIEMPDGQKYAVINQWGKGSLAEFLVEAKKAGYEVEQIVSTRTGREREDNGEPIDEQDITLNDGLEYNIIRRSSNQIQVFQGNTQVIAKEILRRIITERKLDIPTEGLNTQQMGKKVLDLLRVV